MLFRSVIGVLLFVAYRAFRRLPLWEPVAVSAAELQALGRVAVIESPRPTSERVHLHRHRPRAAEPEAPARVAPAVRPRTSVVRAVIILAVAAAVGIAAVAIDLSRLDPFGPRLGWSPGVLLVAALVVRVVLLRGESGDRE